MSYTRKYLDTIPTMLRLLGPKDFLIEFVDRRRRTGKSLGQAFYLIGLAMKAPNIPVPIVDFELYVVDANKRFAKIVQIPLLKEVIKLQKLENLFIDEQKMTLTYKLPLDLKVSDMYRGHNE